LGTRVNTFDRVNRYLQQGSSASVHALVSELLTRLNT
jgi:hypothetical protein